MNHHHDGTFVHARQCVASRDIPEMILWSEEERKGGISCRSTNKQSDWEKRRLQN